MRDWEKYKKCAVLLMGCAAAWLCLSGCQEAAPLEKEALLPQVSLNLDPDGPRRFGEINQARLAVINTTIDPILIERVELRGQLPVPAGGLRSLPGTLRESKAFHHFTYDPNAPGRTAEVFADNLIILPGETWNAEVAIRLRQPQQPLILDYQTIPIEDLFETAYFLEEGPQRSDRRRFVRLTTVRLDAYHRAEAGTLGRAVILPEPDQGWHETVAQSVFIPIENPESSAEILQETSQPAGAEVSFWTREALWLVHHPDTGETMGFKQGGGQETFPPCELPLFDLLDLLPPTQPIPVVHGESGEVIEQATPFGIRLFFNKVIARRQRILVDWVRDEDAEWEYGLYLEDLEPKILTPEDLDQ